MKEEKELVRNETEYIFSQFNEICQCTKLDEDKMDSNYNEGGKGTHQEWKIIHLTKEA